MTPEATQIQTLIDEIDVVLSKANPRLPWVMSNEAAQQRRVLEQTRSYLTTLKEQQATAQSSSLATQPVAAAEESAQQVLQSLLQEMGYLRTNMLQPLRSDIERLNQQREALTQEIRQLEEQRQQALPPAHQQQMVEEFMRLLMNRVQETLSGQVTQAVANLQAANGGMLPGIDPKSLPSTSGLTPEQRLEQMQKLQAQSDQLLLKLDSTLRVIFDSLQTNIHSYQESLGQGLEKMHGLGQQGEAMFAALVNRLAQQLGREASSYLQSSIDTGDWEPAANSALPNRTASQTPSSQAVREEVSDEQIDRLLDELNAGEAIPAEPKRPPVPKTPAHPEPIREEITVFQFEPGIPIFEEDLTRIQSTFPESETPSETQFDEIIDDQTSWSPDADFDRLDSAFESINQLHSEIPETAKAQTDSSASDSGADDGGEDDFYEDLFGSSSPLPEFEFPAAEANGSVSIDSPDPNLPSTASSADSSDDASPDLFGGLFDPAESLTSISEMADSQSEGALPELANPSSADFLFPTDQVAPATAHRPIDTIASLSELIEAVPSIDSQSTNGSTLDLDDEEYMLAPPDEDLLTLEESERTPTTEIEIGETIRSQLAIDLLHFEDSFENQGDSQPTLANFLDDQPTESPLSEIQFPLRSSLQPEPPIKQPDNQQPKYQEEIRVEDLFADDPVQTSELFPSQEPELEAIEEIKVEDLFADDPIQTSQLFSAQETELETWDFNDNPSPVSYPSPKTEPKNVVTADLTLEIFEEALPLPPAPDPVAIDPSSEDDALIKQFFYTSEPLQPLQEPIASQLDLDADLFGGMAESPTIERSENTLTLNEESMMLNDLTGKSQTAAQSQESLTLAEEPIPLELKQDAFTLDNLSLFEDAPDIDDSKKN